MILIFNRAGLLFLFFGGLAVWIAAFVVWAVGADESGVPWALFAFCAITVGFDMASRYFDLFRTGASSLRRVVLPSAGGQMFFIPLWILSVALLVWGVVSAGKN